MVLIDAGILATPSPDDGPSHIHEYVETLLHWNRLLDEPWILVRLGEHVNEALYDAGLLPFRPTLQKAFDKYQIKQYDVNTIAPIFERLLRHTPHFETHFKIHDVEYDNFSSDPDLSSLRAGSTLAPDLDDLERFIVLISILQNHSDASLIVKNASESGKIEVQASISDIDPKWDDMDDIPSPPEAFKGNVIVCDNFTDLIKSVDETRIWTPASDSAADFETALQLAIFKHRLDRGDDSDWPIKIPIILGPMFIGSIKKCFEGGWKNIAFKTLRSIAEVVDEIDMAKTHGIRKSKGGNSHQRERAGDGAKAWRRDIDYEYHLHYWKKGELIELASIVPHNDFSIPE